MDESAPIAVLHADEALVAIDKPAAIAVHRSRLVGRAEEYLIDRVRAATGRTLYRAHRLDRATSGVLLLAADRAMAAALGRQFTQREGGLRRLRAHRGHRRPEGSARHASRRAWPGDIESRFRHRIPSCLSSMPTSPFRMLS
jgi:tRNA pseudouridine65 synthase